VGRPGLTRVHQRVRGRVSLHGKQDACQVSTEESAGSDSVVSARGTPDSPDGHISAFTLITRLHTGNMPGWVAARRPGEREESALATMRGLGINERARAGGPGGIEDAAEQAGPPAVWDPPGELAHAAAWALACETSAAARARTLTRLTLRQWAAGDAADVEDVVLMVDELVTNAIVHGTGPVRLRLRVAGRRLLAEVSDGSPLLPVPSGVDPGGLDWSEAGRGLLLVDALAAEYGARPAGHGKVVWFIRLLRHPAPGAS
jgi:anti-sigma regulatory factor (Ser/Thr protein kinase)